MYYNNISLYQKKFQREGENIHVAVPHKYANDLFLQNIIMNILCSIFQKIC